MRKILLLALAVLTLGGAWSYFASHGYWGERQLTGSVAKFSRSG